MSTSELSFLVIPKYELLKMMNLFRTLTAICFAISLTACTSTPPTDAQIQAAEIGIAPTQEEAEAIANAYLYSTLKDPESAQKQYGEVQRGFYTKAPIYGGGSKIAWYLHSQVNAKNSYGGYTGFESYHFYILNGSLVAVLFPDVMYLSSGPLHHLSVVEFDGGGVDPPNDDG